MIPEAYSRTLYTNSPVTAFRCEVNSEPLFSPPVQKKQKKDITKIDVALQAGWRNLKKAVTEHLERASDKDKHAYISIEQFDRLSNKLYNNLTFECTSSTDIGPTRTSNQDDDFVTPIHINKKMVGILLGVLDGHGSDLMAQIVSTMFQEHFAKEILLAPDNILLVFERTAALVQDELRKKLHGFRGGCVAVICYIDQATGLIYTLTLGDAEAFVYRIINGTAVLIPLSVLRDWGCDKDARRASENGPLLLKDSNGNPLTAPEIKKRMQAKTIDPKSIRLDGLNVSRAFGDLASFFEGRGISQNIKKTVFNLRPHDRIILVCDGITDYLKRRAILSVIKKNRLTEDIVPALINKAIKSMEDKIKQSPKYRHHGDNLTAIAIRVLEGGRE